MPEILGILLVVALFAAIAIFAATRPTVSADSAPEVPSDDVPPFVGDGNPTP